MMEQAVLEAKKAFAQGEVPVGAVLIGPDGGILSRAYNQTIARHDPTAHAEILTIREACLGRRNYRLTGTCLVVTIEPCIMCVGAALNARIERIVFGACDPKGGAVVTLFNLASDSRLNHRIQIISGVMEDECRGLMQDFFRARR
ncbi:MAG: nucleoside deaminase [Desulfobacteraceae bacterium]|nr:MAG: nucleoside deaminase [Desulfobacteraceae bacterium]